MSKKIERDNSWDPQGGFEPGAYDYNAVHPTDLSWTRQSKYAIPINPKELWKIKIENAYIDETIVQPSFAIDRDSNLILSDCDNNILGESIGRIIEVTSSGDVNVLFTAKQKLKSPVLGLNGLIYVTTTGVSDNNQHKLYCLFPSGEINWAYSIDAAAYSKPIIDKEGNIFLFVYGGKIGKLLCISNNGDLIWERLFTSVNWYEPAISKDGLIYLGLNVSQTLLALTKTGDILCEKKVGQGLGRYPLNISGDSTIYACLSDSLLSLDADGCVKWSYKPDGGNVITTPAIDYKGNLYFDLSGFRFISMTASGVKRWEKSVKGLVTSPPIIGSDGNIIHYSFIQGYPRYKSWISIYSAEGVELWTYELEGAIISIVVGTDNVFYVLVNKYTFNKKGWVDKMNVEWELFAFGLQ